MNTATANTLKIAASPGTPKNPAATGAATIPMVARVPLIKRAELFDPSSGSCRHGLDGEKRVKRPDVVPPTVEGQLGHAFGDPGLSRFGGGGDDRTGWRSMDLDLGGSAVAGDEPELPCGLCFESWSANDRCVGGHH